MKCTVFPVFFLASLLSRVSTAPVDDDSTDVLGGNAASKRWIDDRHIQLMGACFMPSAPGQPQAPCAAVQDVGGACAAAGTSPAALQAYGQCLCKGSFFANWLACLGCLRAEGSTSDRDAAFFVSAVVNASSILCPTSTPTPAPAPPPPAPPAPVYTSTYTSTYTTTVGPNVVTVTTVVTETTSTTVTPTTSSTTSSTTSTTTTTESTTSTTTTTTTPTSTSFTTSSLTSSTTDSTTSDTVTSDPLTPETVTSDTATSDMETTDSTSTDPTPT